ncbi:MAG: dehydrogenase [Anaerolineaceae bacterium]|nr:dehydrogenase [Anaerolineaceae bacterium]
MVTAAVVGTGFIGPVHAEALHRMGVNVRGILGSSPEKSREAAQKNGLEIGYDDYQQILDDPQVDVVHITTPNVFHFDMAKRALLAGKHVVCEKPLAMTSAETAELVEIAEANPHLISAVNYNIRFYPMALHAHDLVQKGEIGEVYSVRGGYVQDWLLFDTDWNWRLQAEKSGDTRAIGDIGTHWMDLVGFITGLKVEKLLADLATFIPVRKKPRQAVASFEGKKAENVPVEYDEVQIDTEDWGSVLFKYEGGARGTMNVSQITAGRKNFLNFEIAGSKGALAWNSERPNELWIGHRDRPNEILLKDPSLLEPLALAHADYPGGHNEGFPDTFKQLYKAVYGYLTAGDFDAPKPFPTFVDGHHEVLLCEKIVESNKHTNWVDV